MRARWPTRSVFELMVAVLALAASPRLAAAQSTATFPPEAERPPPPAAAPPPGPAAPQPPAPQASPPAQPAPTAQPPSATPPVPAPSWLEQRGPDVAGQGTPISPSPSSGFRPALLPYREGLPVPAGYHVEERAATGLLVGGSVVLAASYGAGLLVAAVDEFDNGTSWVAVPVVGPFAAIGARSFSCHAVTVENTNTCVRSAFDEVEAIVLLTVDGLIQATGAGLLIAGAVSGHKELVRDDLKVSVTAPAPGREAFQLAVSGQF